jgi:micrococcal nuclease
MKDRLYHFEARVLRVIDGDTFEASVDTGFRNRHETTIRILGINAPEVRGANRAAGLHASAFLRHILEGETVIVRTEKPDAFGRALADVWHWDAEGYYSVAKRMIEAGHAVPTDEKGKTK